MIEAGAGLVEADGTVPGAMAGVHQQRSGQAIARAQQQRGLFRHHQHVEAAKEIQVVAVDQPARGGYGAAEKTGEPRRAGLEPKLHVFDARPNQAGAQTAHFTGQSRVGGDDENLAGEAATRQLQRDGQAVGHLVDLVVIEQETNTHVLQYRT